MPSPCKLCNNAPSINYENVGIVGHGAHGCRLDGHNFALEDWEKLHSVQAVVNSELAADLFSIVEAVAMIGIDFGFGLYELSDEEIQKARKVFDENKELVAGLQREKK